MSVSKPRILILLLRRDLRLHDNPLFHALSHKTHHHSHLLPIYIFNPSHIEISGFLSFPDQKSPYPECRSLIGRFWKCGPHRTIFIAESVWDLKQSLKKLGSDLVLRVGPPDEVIESIIRGVQEGGSADVVGVWMAEAVGSEEKKEEMGVRKAVEKEGVVFKSFEDGSYLYGLYEVPDVFTSFRKTVEPLRKTIPEPLPLPKSLNPIPSTPVAQQLDPFTIPTTLEGLIKALKSPLSDLGLPGGGAPLTLPPGAKTAHPFTGGETSAKNRVHHLLSTGAISTYKDTRNGLLGEDFSCKFAAYFAQGCLSARLVHKAMCAFEEGNSWTSVLGLNSQDTPHPPTPPGFAKGENKGTASIRFELLWRDYFRLCALKFGQNVFSLSGYRGDTDYKWKSLGEARDAFSRFQRGCTGMGLVDASMRELYLTGWTSNRARQNVASYLAKRMGVDWRLGAEWYEMLLVDYDMASNWGNWQYNAGVGNDPRGEGRVFNQVKQGRDYDKGGEYVRTWCEELRNVEGEVWQTAMLKGEEREGVCAFSEDARVSVERPLVVIPDGGGGGGNRRGGGAGGKGRGGKGGGGGGGKHKRVGKEGI
ncbi:cryptochrome [Wilcoxina mikolae CBS 423.85]|nr:cryptochrome [Wilcoxina mikolae CBS 423.85]